MNDKPKLLSAKVTKGSEGTLFLYTQEDAPRIEKEIGRLLATGGKRVYRDGSEEWVNYDLIHDSTKEGVEAYVWDKTGNKVLHEKVLVRKSPAGEITRKVLTKVYRKFED